MVGENRQFVTIDEPMVQDDLNLPDDGGEIPKSQGRGWQFESRLWKLLSTWWKTCQVVNYLLCFGVGLSAFCLKEKKKKKKDEQIEFEK